ncbi:MAG: hypothetical protein M1281_08565 [Chloroflexi bacterium]|nr:hypothetical protein [Chloroflexota bacterium]
MNLAGLQALPLGGLGWLLLALAPFLFIQNRLHIEIQRLLLLITRRPGITLLIFSLIFLPGVALHEISHFAAARLLGVRTGRLSLVPKLLPKGRLRMGFVETAPTDFLREALIGFAPLLVGGALIAFVGLNKLAIEPVWTALKAGDWTAVGDGISRLPAKADFWLWFYLLFAVSSTMFPSASDRRGWLPLGFSIILLLGLALLAGAGPWLLANFAPELNRALYTAAAIFAISLGVHLILILPIGGMRLMIGRLV